MYLNYLRTQLRRSINTRGVFNPQILNKTQEKNTKKNTIKKDLNCPFLKNQQQNKVASVDTKLLLDNNCPFLNNMNIDDDIIQNNKKILKKKKTNKKVDIYHDNVAFALNKLHKNGNYRIFYDIKRKIDTYPLASNQSNTNKKIQNNKDIAIWCSNDYLNLGQRKEVIDAMSYVANKSGVGAGGTRNIAGTTPYHSNLEHEIASLHQKSSALLFSSGYVANDTSIATLGKLIPNLIMYSDELNHASMIEGINHSKCQKHIFKHNDVEHLELLLKSSPKSQPKLILFESVYSMDGDISPIKKICDLADQYNALTLIDEVHAIGMYGKHGAGILEELNLLSKVDLITGTLGKAIGCHGGYITGSELMIDAIRSYAPGFIFTTAIPPPVAAAAIKAIQIIKKENILRIKQQQHAKYLKEQLILNDIPIIKTNTHIVPVMIGNAQKCKEVSDMLLQDYNIYVQPINYPTVPLGTERLRFTPSPKHNKKYIDECVVAIKQTLKHFNLI